MTDQFVRWFQLNGVAFTKRATRSSLVLCALAVSYLGLYGTPTQLAIGLTCQLALAPIALFAHYYLPQPTHTAAPDKPLTGRQRRQRRRALDTLNK
jgi:hypothetical protein